MFFFGVFFSKLYEYSFLNFFMICLQTKLFQNFDSFCSGQRLASEMSSNARTNRLGLPVRVHRPSLHVPFHHLRLYRGAARIGDAQLLAEWCLHQKRPSRYQRVSMERQARPSGNPVSLSCRIVKRAKIP